VQKLIKSIAEMADSMKRMVAVAVKKQKFLCFSFFLCFICRLVQTSELPAVLPHPSDSAR
jgi:hypothetical protein